MEKSQNVGTKSAFTPKLQRTFPCINIWTNQKLSFNTHCLASFNRYYVVTIHVEIQSLCNHYSCREFEIIIDRMTVTVQHCSLLYRTLYFLYGPWLSAYTELMTCLLDGLISCCLLTKHLAHSLDGPSLNSRPLLNCLHVTKIKG